MTNLNSAKWLAYNRMIRFSSSALQMPNYAPPPPPTQNKWWNYANMQKALDSVMHSLLQNPYKSVYSIISLPPLRLSLKPVTTTGNLDSLWQMKLAKVTPKKWRTSKIRQVTGFLQTCNNCHGSNKGSQFTNSLFLRPKYNKSSYYMPIDQKQYNKTSCLSDR